MLGDTVFAGRYRVVRLLGAGAMGAVYEVLDLETDRRRALKVIHERASDRPDAGERWKQEARVVGQIDSPFIVDVFDVGVDEKSQARFLVMELLHGEDLSRRIKRLGALPPAEVVLYLHQAALALDRMHRAGIVHRDLKPGNMFRDERDGAPPRLKILDFGVATEGNSGASGTAGTPMYMAPEQFRDNPQIAATTDVFALGMVAFTLLTGRAYWGDAWERCRDKVSFALIAVQGPVEPPSVQAAGARAGLPAEFDAWFARATAVDPDQRFPSAGLAARELGRVFGVELPAEQPAATDHVPPGASRASGAPLPVRAVPTLPVDTTMTAASISAGANDRDDAAERSVSPARSRRSLWNATWLRPLGAVLLVTAIALPVRQALRKPRGSVASIPRSPLEGPNTVLGCPVMKVSGVDAPAGWLGAAAASLFCERARLVLGGTTARTRVPAELLSLPREPTDGFPADPYASADASSRSLEAARHETDAYIEGRVAKVPDGFHVSISFRSKDAELARADGSGRALFEAVRATMQPLIDQRLLPWAKAFDPAVLSFSQARNPAAALALLDMSLAFVQNAGGLEKECARIERLGDSVGIMQQSERFRCAYTLGLPPPAMNLPPDSSAAAIATRARIQQMVQRGDDRLLAQQILRLFDAERSSWGRSVLAATASCLLQSSDPERAAQMARRAVQAEPKNPTGEFCAPWVQLVAVTRGTPSARSAARAMQAWAPWDGYGWLLDALEDRDGATALSYARRAYTLSPFDMYVVRTLADKLLARGDREEVRNIALSLASGAYPVLQLASELLLVRVEASEASFGAALGRARRAMRIDGSDSGWTRVQRLDIAWQALEITEILGRRATATIADEIFTQFLMPEPPPLDGAHLDVPLRIPAICARATGAVAVRCFARFRSLRDRLSGGILPETDGFTKGAEHYARGELHLAARAWSPLLKEPAVFAPLMFEPMATTFERVGQSDQVERLSAAAPDRSVEFHGASLGVVRAARSAARHGERDKARTLARQIIDAWSVADVPVPAVQEMRRLVASYR